MALKLGYNDSRSKIVWVALVATQFYRDFLGFIDLV